MQHLCCPARRRDQIRLMTLGKLQCGAALAFLCLTTACQTGFDPAMQGGAAGYDAIALPPGQPLPTSYALRRGDVVSVEVFQEPDLTQTKIAIDNGGNLNLPLIGEVQAAGLSAAELSQIIQQAYGQRYLRDPKVTVVVNDSQPYTFSVEGHVALPGVFPHTEGMTLLAAIAQARSPTQVAKLDQVVVFRTVDGQRVGGVFDLDAIRTGSMADPLIVPGDVVVVGYSQLRGAYRDILQAAPLIGVFRPF